MNKKANSALAILGVVAVLALGGLLWTGVVSPTGNDVVASNMKTAAPVPNLWVPPPLRQAYACECAIPGDAGICAVRGCFDGESARDRCLSVLPKGAACQPCQQAGSIQRAEAGVHVIGLASCNTRLTD